MPTFSLPNWPYPRLFAHRGGGNLAPENTLAGIRKAAQYGFRGVEFDVRLTACGTAILMHDATLDRTTDGTGQVHEAPFAEIAKLDAGSWFHPSYAEEPVPTLEEAARLCIELDLHANVEIKPGPGHETTAGAVIGELTRDLWRSRAHPPLLSSFSEPALAAARAAAPQLPRGLLVRAPFPGWKTAVRQLDCLSLHCAARSLRAQQITEVLSERVFLLAYTVNQRTRAQELWRQGVSALFTDNLAKLCRAS